MRIGPGGSSCKVVWRSLAAPPGMADASTDFYCLCARMAELGLNSA